MMRFVVEEGMQHEPILNAAGWRKVYENTFALITIFEQDSNYLTVHLQPNCEGETEVLLTFQVFDGRMFTEEFTVNHDHGGAINDLDEIQLALNENVQNLIQYLGASM